MRWCRSAAAADSTCPHLHQRPDTLCKLLRCHMKYSLSIDDDGQSCICIDHDRQRTARCQLRQQVFHLFRSQTTVKTNRINAQPFQHRCHACHITAGQELAALIKYHCDDDGQIRVFLCRKDCCLDLIRIAHRLDQNDVRARLVPCDNDFLKRLVCLIKRNLTERL